MSQQSPDAGSEGSPRGGDPWHAVGYIVAGVGFYGLLGWLADQWLGTRFLVAVGVLLGAALGIYATFVRFNRAIPHDPPKQ